MRFLRHDKWGDFFLSFFSPTSLQEWETRDDEEATEAAVTVASAKGAATKAAATVKPNLRAIRKAARKALKDARRKARKERKARRQARKGGKKSRKGRWSFANRRFVYKKLKSRK